MNDAEQTFRFDPEWRTTLFVALLVPLMASLGVWQLQRADDKELLATVFEQRQAQAPAPLAALWDRPAEELAYLPTQLRGSFPEDAYFLLDNRMRGGKFGYEVLAVMRLEGGRLALVNRGWIAGDPVRQVLPQVPALPGVMDVSGHIYVAPGDPYLLAEQHLEGGWPQRIQAVEMGKLVPFVEGRFKGERLFPYPVRVAPGSSAALSAQWQVINVSPEKHLGYAVQWFAMSAVLLLFYILRSTNLWQLITGRPAARV